MRRRSDAPTRELPADRLRDLARRVRALRPDRHDAERFLLERETVAAELARIARSLEVAR